MSAARSKVADEAPTSVPQTTPFGIGYGHPEYQFVQSIMEMQKSLGEINASIQALGKSVEGVKAKVDKLEEWKNMILGGAIVAGVLISVAVFLVTKASDYITLKAPAMQSVPAAAPQAATITTPPPAPATPIEPAKKTP